MKPQGIARGEKARRRAAKLKVRIAKHVRYVLGRLKRDVAAAQAHVDSLEAAAEVTPETLPSATIL